MSYGLAWAWCFGRFWLLPGMKTPFERSSNVSLILVLDLFWDVLAAIFVDDDIFQDHKIIPKSRIPTSFGSLTTFSAHHLQRKMDFENRFILKIYGQSQTTIPSAKHFIPFPLFHSIPFHSIPFHSMPFQIPFLPFSFFLFIISC